MAKTVHILTWVEINIGSDTGSDECHSQWARHGCLIIEHLELIQMCMAKKLPSNCTFISTGKKRKEKVKQERIFYNLSHLFSNW